MANAAGHGIGSYGTGIIVTVSVMLTGLYLLLFYLFSRLRFAFFDVVLRRDQLIAPSWRRHGAASLKWTAFKVVVGLVVTAFIAVPTMAAFRSFVSIMSSIKVEPGQQPSAQFFTSILSVYAAFGLLYLVIGFFYFFSSIVGDFIVPSLALENTGLGEAFRRFGKLIQNETGQFLLYTMMKFVLGVAGYMGFSVAFQMAFLLLLLVVGIIAGGIGFLLYLAHVPVAVLIGLAIALAIAIYLFVLIYALPILFGTFLTFLEAYLLYFLGGRYPMLGALLESTTPPAPVPSPIYQVPFVPGAASGQ